MAEEIPGSPDQKQEQVEKWVDEGVDPDLAQKAVDDKAPQPDPVEEVATKDVTDLADAKVVAPAEPYEGDLPASNQAPEGYEEDAGNTTDFEGHLEADRARRQAESARADAAENLEPFENAFLEADEAVKDLEANRNA